MTGVPLAGDGPVELDLLRFPLRGSQLIEAGAGTGKTFAIAALYLRLVLGHGAANGWRPLAPREILVVTFTEAATEELRERIRRRLAEAATRFREIADDRPAAGAGEDLLDDLRGQYAADQWPACARRLQLAAEAMDEAAVWTIHGWCQRMLREHAFDSNSLFVQTLEADQEDLLGEVVRDYWRSFVVPLDAQSLGELMPWWADPDGLRKALGGLVDHAGSLCAAESPALSVPRARTAREQRLGELKAPWIDWVDELEQLLDEAVARRQVDGRRLQARHYRNWLAALRTWRDDAGSVSPNLGKGWERLASQGIAELWRNGCPPAHPGWQAISGLQAALAELPDARAEVLRHAARWVAERLAAEQLRRARMGFQDLLTRLDAALHGPSGERLAAVIRAQFPIALIDEFQDTDPLQYRIFDAIYRVERNDPATALVLIGDPKQAIYAFRGADIHTYLRARKACAGRLHTLSTNHRSTRAMVEATNRCFAFAEQRRDGSGAFLFRGAGGNPLPFTAAVARGRDDVLVAEGVELPALTAWWLPPGADGGELGKEASREQIAAACASEIVRLLRLGAAGQAGFTGSGRMRPLTPADVAVLVNARVEADTIRKALGQRGVRSVYLSERESVFASGEAAELQNWLAACADPDDPRCLRRALASRLLAVDWRELDVLEDDDRTWEARVEQFRAYRECWRGQGVLPMLRRLLNDFAVPLRLLDDSDPARGATSGERVLTNLLHLAELLQQASVLLEGEHALIRHLAEQRHDASAGVGGDVRQLRLESDEGLVQVVTVHKSKGLEYPLVFVPFASSCRRIDGAKDLPLRWHDDAGELQLALVADPSLVEGADRERLAEDMRKLYVALTRARYATWVGFAPIADLAHSAAGYLLGAGEEIAVSDLPRRLEELRGGLPQIVVAQAPEAGDERFSGPLAPASGSGQARIARRAVRQAWGIASYSSLRVAGDSVNDFPATPAETPVAALVQETLAGVVPGELALPPSGEPRGAGRPTRPLLVGALHDFPRGAEAGTFLHGLLEAAAGHAFSWHDPAPLRERIVRNCRAHGWDRWIEPLAVWLEHFLSTPWRLPPEPGRPAHAVRLAELGASAAEMEFALTTRAVDTGRIDELVCRHTLAGAPRPRLPARRLDGLLRGFIDLVFEHCGLYYVADWKSNWLGAEDAAYTPEAMRGAILHARYDLQYALYLVALHRLLKLRLPDYDYDRHVGGAVYLFLRGSFAAGQGIHFERPPRQLIEALDQLFSGQSAEQSG
ncbi:exodeoxyribonuclease V subunit beta [Accumulibacter sp.]|uniref:exodeoxyribonuclease V subunit beta n=1 Tax=Accumulibacter sp. TaxID=2053492 RepID=UPI0026001A8E|nr:exodeoxyribonuclease V subunit beta [Accumulibacter sp.]MCM8596321.1 exodeoxyribonuclease V subunit beta [Accumulibacter sp.]MDS4050470.1 exodeoxyribonuclease V subunit beta [Accumulibacter sp.]